METGSLTEEGLADWEEVMEGEGCVGDAEGTGREGFGGDEYLRKTTMIVR